MRLAYLSFAAGLLLCSAPVHAETSGFGIGLIVGQPTGITGAVGLSDNTMLDAAVGLDIFDDRDFYVHVEFLYFLPTLVKGNSFELSAYLGIGGFLVAHKDATVGARAPFGLSLDFANAPLQVFGEASLLVPLVPEPDAAVRGAAGFRYYF